MLVCCHTADDLAAVLSLPWLLARLVLLLVL
jgi:hypothetical protein